MNSDRLETCRHIANADHSIEDILNDPGLCTALELDGIDTEQLTDLLTAIRTRLLAQRWRTAA